jgi:ABC-type phosphate/phosphonate transport system substrate-binding protein
MVLHEAPRRPSRQRCVLVACALALPLVFLAAVARGQQQVEVLRIGASGSLTGEGKEKEKGARESLKGFIKDETGFKNEILRQKSWRELADKMVKKQLHLGVFQGYEFAWAQEEHPDLKPLAIAVNVYRYPVAYVVVKRTNPAKNFAGLQGQSLSLPSGGEAFLRLFVDRECQTFGKKADAFFSKITTPDNVEDALDAVVDGKVQVSVADRASLEAYKRRKPGRFKQLREVAQSQPFPPPVVAYYDAVLDQATLDRFRQGLLSASSKERGQTMLTLFRLTGFETVPEDFGKVLAATRKAYPPPHAGAK